jgi:hypothetical protein
MDALLPQGNDVEIRRLRLQESLDKSKIRNLEGQVLQKKVKKPLSWTYDFPTSVGWYFFYGYRFTPNWGEKPTFYLARVREAQFSNPKRFLYTTGSHGIYKTEGAFGLWTPAILPDPPELPAHPAVKKKKM